ncbi:MAG: UDP-N-acetylmuramoyl-tripeptide--D-alanyl-D-alanine ligase [Candidatus Yanofskybacteria bacterium]|nr:UDP-N-acetylmuramoyl-tripeptide--D-alanyl-D-alanine ligase [Candidatus Yanofskybacteria bacterium]
MTKLLTLLLTLLARMYVWRFRPVIVGITGNAGKTTTKEAVAAVLATRYRVRATGGNLNNELGLPATIIGDHADAYYREGGTRMFWLSVLAGGIAGLFGSAQRYPEVLVLEYGADRPGDIRRLAARFRPTVAVVTQVGDVPVHVEFFASPRELAVEKAQLVRALSAQGDAVLNGDDLSVLEMRDATKAETHTFGIGPGASVRVSDIHVKYSGERPVGVSFNITADGASMPCVVSGVIGAGVARAAAAAVAVGMARGIGLADAVEAVSRMSPPPGRLHILSGIRGSIVIDDTYNASPAAMHIAIDAIRELPGRKVLVLGDMRELGSYSVQAHQSIGTMAAAVADELVAVGESGRFIADAAGNQLAPERVHWYPDSAIAAPEVQRLIRSGDVVLVKGSQGVRMERIVREIMAEPQRAPQLLVRQSARWLTK